MMRDRRVFLRFALLALCMAASAQAQNTLSIRVEPSPVGAGVTVDGIRYTTPQLFIWQENSQHSLVADAPPTALQAATEFVFDSWTDPGGGLFQSAQRAITITASRAVTTYRALYNPFHRIIVRTYDPASGTIEINGEAITGDRTLHLAAGSEVLLRASPAPGWVFQRWSSQGRPPGLPVQRWQLNGPLDLHPVFARGRRVTLLTNPPGLNLLIDRTETATPITLDWAHLGTYRLSAFSPQRDAQNRFWIIDLFRRDRGEPVGPPETHYVVNDIGDFTLVGHFRRGVPATFETSPHGLRLSIEGRENWLQYQFVWPEGIPRTIAAPLEQHDTEGRLWQFASWAHGGDATQTLLPSVAMADAGGVRWLARYQRLPRLSLDSTAGAPLLVDGSPCASPCLLDRAPGTALRLAAPETVEAGPGTRFEFSGWSDGAPRERTLALSEDLALRALYRRLHRIVTAVTPDEAGSVQFAASPGGFVVENTPFVLTAQPEPGFRFVRWEGDVFGQSATLEARALAPLTIRAVFERGPWVDPSGIRNSAAPEHSDFVAPGSRIRIRGRNLAEVSVAASRPVLPQTLGDVTVSWNDRLLPLIGVTPDYVDALLPLATPPGPLRLTVRRPGQPDVAAEGQVVRNAPALYPNGFAQADGTVTLLATGLGPWSEEWPDGFPAPPGVLASPLDPVSVLVDDTELAPLTVSPARELPGIAVLTVRLPAGSTEVRLRVAGRLSNAVAVPR